MNMNLGPAGGNMPNMNMGGRFNPLPPEQPNPLHVTFQNPHWAPNSINAETVLHYFCDQNNPFYDRTSDNEQLKMQNMGLQNLGALNQDLTRMTGMQYVLHSSSPPLFVICKQKRNSPVNVTPICYYYVLNGIIYQAPDLYTSVQSRLVGAVEPLKKALQQTLEMSRFNVTKGYSWDFKSKPAKQEKKKTEDDEDGEMGAIEESMRTRATPYQTIRTEMLLRLLYDQFPSDSQPNQSQADDHAASSVSNTARTDTTSFHPIGNQESGPTQSMPNLDLPTVLPNLLPGVSQMATDALSRLSQISQHHQRQDEEMRMDVDHSNR